jgi:hypothetical protein
MDKQPEENNPQITPIPTISVEQITAAALLSSSLNNLHNLRIHRQ